VQKLIRTTTDFMCQMKEHFQISLLLINETGLWVWSRLLLDNSITMKLYTSLDVAH